LFLLDSFRDLAVSWGQRIVKFLVMGPLAFLAALVLFAFTNAIFTASMADGLKYLLIVGLSWLAWRLLRPHTALGKMHLPGKKLLGHVLAMKFAMRTQSARRGRGDGKDGQDADSGSEQEKYPSAVGDGRSDRLVYTPSRVRNDKSGAVGGEHQEVLYYGEAAPAGATLDPLPEARLGPTVDSPQGAASAAAVVDAGRCWRPSGEPDPYQLKADTMPVADLPSVESEPVTAPIDVVSQARPTWRQGRLPAHDRPLEALRAAGRPLVGNLLEEGSPLPATVHEANLTHDRDGRPVFQVYRPEGSRFYVQDE
jgi:hypothetical protein